MYNIFVPIYHNKLMYQHTHMSLSKYPPVTLFLCSSLIQHILLCKNSHFQHSDNWNIYPPSSVNIFTPPYYTNNLPIFAIRVFSSFFKCRLHFASVVQTFPPLKRLGSSGDVWFYSLRPRLVSSSWNFRCSQLSSPCQGRQCGQITPARPLSSSWAGQDARMGQFSTAFGLCDHLPRLSGSSHRESRPAIQRSSVLDSIWRMMRLLCMLFVSYKYTIHSIQQLLLRVLTDIEGRLSNIVVQHSAYRGSSRRRNGATSHKVVWPQMISTCLRGD